MSQQAGCSPHHLQDGIRGQEKVRRRQVKSTSRAGLVGILTRWDPTRILTAVQFLVLLKVLLEVEGLAAAGVRAGERFLVNVLVFLVVLKEAEKEVKVEEKLGLLQQKCFTKAEQSNLPEQIKYIT